MNDIQRILKYKEDAERLNRKAERAQGAYDQIMKELKERYGSDDIKELQRTAEKLQRKVLQEEKELEQKEANFLEEYGHELEETEAD